MNLATTRQGNTSRKFSPQRQYFICTSADEGELKSFYEFLNLRTWLKLIDFLDIGLIVISFVYFILLG